MRAIVLVKQVPDLRLGGVGVRPDGTIDRAAAAPITNPADMHALEAAAQLADEVWALAERRAGEQGLHRAFYAGLAAVMYLNWLLWTGLGTGLGAVIANPAAWGFDFAFTALFIGLVADGRVRAEADPLLYFHGDYWDLGARRANG